jgi:hypothetical protein
MASRKLSPALESMYKRTPKKPNTAPKKGATKLRDK